MGVAQSQFDTETTPREISKFRSTAELGWSCTENKDKPEEEGCERAVKTFIEYAKSENNIDDK
jgi:hypothetical protein